MPKCGYFYVYHNTGQCKCVQDDTGCDGNTDDCENRLGRRSFEDDMWEEGLVSRIVVCWRKVWRNLY